MPLHPSVKGARAAAASVICRAKRLDADCSAGSAGGEVGAHGGAAPWDPPTCCAAWGSAAGGAPPDPTGKGARAMPVICCAGQLDADCNAGGAGGEADACTGEGDACAGAAPWDPVTSGAAGGSVEGGAPSDPSRKGTRAAIA